MSFGYDENAGWNAGAPSSARLGVAWLPSAEVACSAILFITLVMCYGWDAPKIVGGTIDTTDAAGAEAGDRLRQVAFLLLFACAAAVRSVAREPRWVNSIPFVLLPVLAWCWLSILWAIDPLIALRRVAFATVVVFTISTCVQLLSYRRIISILTIACWTILLADWVAVGLFQHAVHQPTEADQSLVGSWRGGHNGKNEAGAFCAIAIILFVHEAVKQRSFLTGGTSIVLAAVFLIQTHSKTSLLMVITALLIGIAVSFTHHRLRIRLAIGLVLLGTAIPAGIAYADVLTQELTSFLADPASLTGRVQIWPVLLNYAGDNLLLGSGYGSFWGIGADSPVNAYATGWVTEIYSAHNGYLEVLVQTGVVGLSLAVLLLICWPMHLLLSANLPDGMSRSLVCSVQIFGWLRDTMESSLLGRAESTWIIMVIMYCLLCKYGSWRSRAIV